MLSAVTAEASCFRSLISTCSSSLESARRGHGWPTGTVRPRVSGIPDCKSDTASGHWLSARNWQKDLTVVTTMMESRHLAGDTGLIEALAEIIDPSAMWPPNDFIRGKLSEQQNRHDRYSNTEYALEPNIKSSPGGLRDLQVIEWITLRCFGEGLGNLNEPDF
ncbi:MAG: hypothetical protein CM15mP92_1720 [Halieaceae bacterium]|nr:MAG: hypothetical protein CM15mP92_1720 [Halieaceae bacterium]